MTTTIEPIEGRWWYAEGSGAVWPCEVLSHSYFHVAIRPTLGPHQGERLTLHPNAVYDSGFHHVRDAARKQREEAQA